MILFYGCSLAAIAEVDAVVTGSLVLQHFYDDVSHE